LPNTIRYDPTRTTTLRGQYSREMRRRFYAVRTLVTKALVELDVLGLSETRPISFNALTTNVLPEAQAFRFQTSDQKVRSFNRWLQTEIDAGILETDVAGKPWTAKYIDSSYRKGTVRAYTDAHAEDLAESPEFYRGSQQQFLATSFTQPERLSKLKMLYTRSYEDLKGITSAMSQKISRTLADGIGNGLNPRVIARTMSKEIAKITRTRALVMARTEVIYAHAEGQLDSFAEMGIEELTVMAEWSTAGDDRVCEECAALDGTVMTIAEARGLIPRHPNCRCAWQPANVGEKAKNRFWTKAQKERRIEKSLKAGLPKRTRSGQKVPQTVAEAKRRSTWAGKDVRVRKPPAGVSLNAYYPLSTVRKLREKMR